MYAKITTDNYLIIRECERIGVYTKKDVQYLRQCEHSLKFNKNGRLYVILDEEGFYIMKSDKFEYAITDTSHWQEI